MLSLGRITVASGMVVRGSRAIIELLGISDTFYGMAILAFLISIEEVARELPAALKGTLGGHSWKRNRLGLRLFPDERRRRQRSRVDRRRRWSE